jgi:hypothetical protein
MDKCRYNTIIAEDGVNALKTITSKAWSAIHNNYGSSIGKVMVSLNYLPSKNENEKVLFQRAVVSLPYLCHNIANHTKLFQPFVK